MKKLKTKRQMLLYAISGMGVNMLNLMMGSYLCSALIASGFGKDVTAYQTFAQKDLVIAAVWAVFGLVAKIIDGIIDVPMASLTDNLKSRWGRRRPSLMIGFIPMVAAYLLFLVVPNDGATLWNTIYYGVVLCVFYSFYTLTMVTYYATFTEIVDSERDRSFISNVKSVCDIIYFILGYVGVRAMLNGMNIRTVALIVLPLSLTMMIPMFMIHEPSTLNGVGEKTESVSIIKSLRCTFRNKAFILWMIVYAFMTFGVQLWMYATPIVYPMSQLGAGWMRTILMVNPVTAPVEVFRYAVLGQGTIMPGYLALSWAVTAAVVVIGVMIFNRVEKTFMDTV